MKVEFKRRRYSSGEGRKKVLAVEDWRRNVKQRIQEALTGLEL